MEQDSKAESLLPEPVDSGSPEIDDETVAAYLQDHRDFLVRHPELLAALAPPGRWPENGNGNDAGRVVDMQQFMLERLRGEIDNLRASALDLIDTSRRNLSIQNRTHAAALALLGAQDFAHMLRIVGDDLPLLLDVDAVVIGFEPPPAPLSGLVLPEVRPLATGTVDRMLGNVDVKLLRETSDDGTIFGAAAGLVRSAALARLMPSEKVPVGLLAFGSRGRGVFHTGQGTDLIGFLAHVAERCARRWLEEAS
jgi:uncharacterized protein YigA (DUF484 family)